MLEDRNGMASGWAPKAGFSIGVLTLLFFMALLIASIGGYDVPCQSAYLVNIVLSLGAALATAFLAGDASVKGKLPGFLPGSPLAVSAGGGIAVLIVMLVLMQNLGPLEGDCGDGDAPETGAGTAEGTSFSCPVGTQSYEAASYGFGFCYPRSGWELDVRGLDLGAPDVYLRLPENDFVGMSLNVSVIPDDYLGRPDDYSANVAATWRQLDPQLDESQDAIGGRAVRVFALRMAANGRQRPVEITHLYIDDERLLEIILMWFDDTEEPTVNTLRQVRSSVSLLD